MSVQDARGLPAMRPTVLVGDWTTLGARAGAVREAVFVVEQRIPRELEWDGADGRCIHAVAVDGEGRALGTGRLLPDGHIGRMAVLREARGQGVGSALLLYLMQAARERGDRLVVLSAQCTAEPFYARHGFKRIGIPYEEAGIPHVRMQRAP